MYTYVYIHTYTNKHRYQYLKSNNPEMLQRRAMFHQIYSTRKNLVTHLTLHTHTPIPATSRFLWGGGGVGGVGNRRHFADDAPVIDFTPTPPPSSASHSCGCSRLLCRCCSRSERCCSSETAQEEGGGKLKKSTTENCRGDSRRISPLQFAEAKLHTTTYGVA